MVASVTDAGPVTAERKQILIASAAVICISLGVLIPRLSILFGWVFTITGGVVGGGLIGGLRRRDGLDGLVYGAYVGVIGGLVSSLLGAVLGTLINIASFVSRTSLAPATAPLPRTLSGPSSGMVFKVIGATMAGGLVGALLDERD